MAESGIEGEIRDWKDLMDEWEAKNDPQVAKAIAAGKEKAFGLRLQSAIQLSSNSLPGELAARKAHS